MNDISQWGRVNIDSTKTRILNFYIESKEGAPLIWREYWKALGKVWISRVGSGLEELDTIENFYETKE